MLKNGDSICEESVNKSGAGAKRPPNPPFGDLLTLSILSCAHAAEPAFNPSRTKPASAARLPDLCPRFASSSLAARFSALIFSTA